MPAVITIIYTVHMYNIKYTFLPLTVFKGLQEFSHTYIYWVF